MEKLIAALLLTAHALETSKDPDLAISIPWPVMMRLYDDDEDDDDDDDDTVFMTMTMQQYRYSRRGTAVSFRLSSSFFFFFSRSGCCGVQLVRLLDRSLDYIVD